MALKEYKPGQAFSGVIGRTFDVSQPAWPAPNRAKEGAPGEAVEDKAAQMRIYLARQ